VGESIRRLTAFLMIMSIFFYSSPNRTAAIKTRRMRTGHVERIEYMLNSYKISFRNQIKKQYHYTPWSAWGERRYSFYSFSTTLLGGGE
jgi:hypothetical protein